MTLVRHPVLTSRTTFDHDHAVMTVAGELDMSTAADLYDALAEVVDRHPRDLTVDLSSPTPPVRRVLEIVGLDHLLVA